MAIVDLDGDKAERTAGELVRRRRSPMRCDVTSESDVEQAVAAAIEALEGLRFAVSCAGIGWAERVVGRDGPGSSSQPFETVVRVNLIGSFNVLRYAAAAMGGNEPDREGERGAVVMTASIAAYDGQIGQIAYAASNGGVVGLTLPAARDLARRGIRVCMIAPGPVERPPLAGSEEKLREALGAPDPVSYAARQNGGFARLDCRIAENATLNGEAIPARRGPANAAEAGLICRHSFSSIFLLLLTRRLPMPEPVIVDAVRTPIGRALKGCSPSCARMRLGAIAGGPAARAQPRGRSRTDRGPRTAGRGLPQGLQAFNIGAHRRAALEQLPRASTARRCRATAPRRSTRSARRQTPRGRPGRTPTRCRRRVGLALERAEAGGRGREREPAGQNGDPDAYIAMGLTAENVAEKYEVSRSDMDKYAQRSQELAVASQEDGYFDREIVRVTLPDGTVVAKDDGPRAEPHAGEAGAARPGVQGGRQVTAGNSARSTTARPRCS